MQDHQTQSSSDEIDLGVVFDKIKSFFKSILIGIVQIFQFFWNHKFVLLGLLVVGAIFGYYLESNTEKIYKNEIVLQPNFGSSDYLYSKVDVINAKIKTKDSIFLSTVFGDEWRKSWKIEIEPIVDIFELTSRDNKKYKETFELLLEESGKVSFIEEDPAITRAYKHHKILFYNEGPNLGGILSNNLMSYLNDSDYYKSVQEVSLENTQDRIDQNLLSLAQIDTLVKSASVQNISKLDSEGISFNAAQNINELLARKRSLLIENRELFENLTSYQAISKLVNLETDIVYKDEILMKNKLLITPLFLILFYCLIFFVKLIIRKSKELIKA
jgi:hypothetical protein